MVNGDNVDGDNGDNDLLWFFGKKIIMVCCKYLSVIRKKSDHVSEYRFIKAWVSR